MILAGDVGGTKTNLALYESAAGRLARRELRSFPSGDYSSFESLLAEFLAGRGDVSLACIGVAGPVVAGSSRLTNLPWAVARESVGRLCGARRSFLINDLQATAYAVPFLPPGDLAVLQEGEADAEGNVGVIAAGTGLGMAFLVRTDGRVIPVATEGGHVDFAPRNDFEFRLMQFLKPRYGRVSVERVVSGPGLHAIYRFLRESEEAPDSPDIEARLSAGDPSRAIVRAALANESATCRAALLSFTSLYGCQAGNLALQVMAGGGIYLGGGIAPAILPALRWGAFLDSFGDKGRFREFLSRVPVTVIMDDTAALLGAAHYARAMAEGD